MKSYSKIRFVFESTQNLYHRRENEAKMVAIALATLLKTTSVHVSSIQIMQIRVQNKGKRVWKSRYNGDISRSGDGPFGSIEGEGRCVV